MKLCRTLRAVIIAMTCLGVALPQQAIASKPVVVDGIPVSKNVIDLSLQQGQLVGGLVDANGNGVADAPVVIAQQGKPVLNLRTDAEGRFAAKGVKPGIYQVVSHGALENYRVWEDGTAPEGAKKGVIHRVNPEVARGASQSGLLAMLSNPLVLTLIIATAIAIPVALNDGDDNS